MVFRSRINAVKDLAEFFADVLEGFFSGRERGPTGGMEIFDLVIGSQNFSAVVKVGDLIVQDLPRNYTRGLTTGDINYLTCLEHRVNLRLIFTDTTVNKDICQWQM